MNSVLTLLFIGMLATSYPNLLSTTSSPIKCFIEKTNESLQEAILSCEFPLNVSQTRQNFNVQYRNKSNEPNQNNIKSKPNLLMNCVWREKIHCVGKEIYRLLSADLLGTSARFQIPIEVAKQHEFSCHLTRQPPGLESQPCLLYPSDVVHKSSTSAKDIIIGSIIGGVLTVVVIIVLFVLINIRRKKKKHDMKNIEPAPTDAQDDNDAHLPLINKRDKVIITNEVDEDLTVWIKKQLPLLHKWKCISTKSSEDEIFQHMKDCLILKNKIIIRMDRHKQYKSNAVVTEDDLEGHKSLQSILSNVEEALTTLTNRQKTFFQKKLNAKIRSLQYENGNRLQAMDDFITLAAQKLEEVLSDDENELVDNHISKLMTMMEIRMELEHHEKWFKRCIEGETAGGKLEYKKKLEFLREKFVDCELTNEASLNQALKTIALRRSNDTISDLRERYDADLTVTTQCRETDLSLKPDCEQMDLDKRSDAVQTLKAGTTQLQQEDLLLEQAHAQMDKQSKVDLPLKEATPQILDADIPIKPDYEEMVLDKLTDAVQTLKARTTQLQQEDLLLEQAHAQKDKQSKVDLPLKEATPQPLDADIPIKPDYEHMMKTLDKEFPNLETENYIVPAVHIKHIHTTPILFGSKTVSVVDNPATSSQHSTRLHINDLDDVQHILHAFFSQVMKTTWGSEAMIVIRQTNVSLYNKPAVPDMTLDEKNLENILKLKTMYSDLMIVNKQRGILCGIVQSVHLTDPVKVGQEFADSLSKLKDAENIIKEGIKTIPKADDVVVRMTLILPNICRKQLDGKLALQKAVQNVTCLYKDELESDNDLRTWWDDIWLPRQRDTMSNNLYRNLVARFALPAIKVHSFLNKPDHDVQPDEGNTAGFDMQTERQQLPLRQEEGNLLDFDALDEAHNDVKFLYGTDGQAMTRLLYLRAHQWKIYFKAEIIFQLQTTEDGSAYFPTSTDFQSEQGNLMHVDISKLYSKDPDDATVVLKEEGKETLLAALGLSPPGQSHTAIHIVADKADGDVVAAFYQWLKQEPRIKKPVRLWSAGIVAPKNKKNGNLPLQHICHDRCQRSECVEKRKDT